MPVLTAISNGTNAAGQLQDYLKLESNLQGALDKYLENEGRSLGCVTSPNISERHWARDMAAITKAYGHDEDRQGRNAIWWKHYAFSPKKEDNCTVDQLLNMAQEWCEFNFGKNSGRGEYSYAIEIHEDNTNSILHAHCVINTSNLQEPHNKLHLSDRETLAINDSAQIIGLNQGMESLYDITGEFKKFNTSKEVYLEGKERQLLKKNKLSTKMIARRVMSETVLSAGSEEKFIKLMAKRGYKITLNKEGDDYLIQYKDNNPITGIRFGTLFERNNLLQQIERNTSGIIDTPEYRQYRNIAACAKANNVHEYVKNAINTVLSYSVDINELKKNLEEQYGINAYQNDHGETVYGTPINFNFKSFDLGPEYSMDALVGRLNPAFKETEIETMVNDFTVKMEQGVFEQQFDETKNILWYDELKSKIESAMMQANTKEEFESILKTQYQIELPRNTEKTISFLMTGHKQVRGQRLGERYGAPAISAYFRNKSTVSDAIIKASIYSIGNNGFKNYLRDNYDIKTYEDKETGELVFTYIYDEVDKNGEAKSNTVRYKIDELSLPTQVATTFVVFQSVSYMRIPNKLYRKMQFAHKIQKQFDVYTDLSEMLSRYNLSSAKELGELYINLSNTKENTEIQIKDDIKFIEQLGKDFEVSEIQEAITYVAEATARENTQEKDLKEQMEQLIEIRTQENEERKKNANDPGISERNNTTR